MTLVQKIIAYSAIVIGILAVLLAFGSSIHVVYYIYTSPGFTTTATNIKGKKRQNEQVIFHIVSQLLEISNNQSINPADPLIINSSQVVDVSHWNTNYVKVFAIGGGGAGVTILKCFTIINALAAVSVSTLDVAVISY